MRATSSGAGVCLSGSTRARFDRHGIHGLRSDSYPFPLPQAEPSAASGHGPSVPYLLTHSVLADAPIPDNSVRLADRLTDYDHASSIHADAR